MGEMSLAKRWMSILWSAFLMAAVLEMAVFALVDPSSLHGLGGEALGLAPLAVYTLAFFLFWAVIAVGAALALLLCRSPAQINHGEIADAPPR